MIVGQVTRQAVTAGDRIPDGLSAGSRGKALAGFHGNAGAAARNGADARGAQPVSATCAFGHALLRPRALVAEP